MIPQNEFNLAIGFALACAASPKSARSDLQGILFHFLTPSTIRIIATDGQRIAAITLAANPEHGQLVGSQFFMAKSAAQDLVETFQPGVASEVVLAIYNSSMIVTNGAEVLEIPETPMAFPSYNSIFEPEQPAAYGEACYNVSHLTDALNLCAAFTDRWLLVRSYSHQAGYFRPDVSGRFLSIVDVAVAIMPATRA